MVVAYGDMSDNKEVKGQGKKGNGVKLFCSYCHVDDKYRQRFTKQIALLKEKGLVSEWYDRMIQAGDDWQATIDENLGQAEVIVLFLSPDFISSKNCRKEAEAALRLREDQEVTVIPVILRVCEWDDWDELAQLQALPERGKPIFEWSSPDKAWASVYSGIKEVVIGRVEKKRKVFDHFWNQMTSPISLVSNSGEESSLESVFVYPSLMDETIRADSTFKNAEISSESFVRLDDTQQRCLLVIGGDQCGKSALCQMLFVAHWNAGRIPVYVDGSSITNQNLENLVRTQTLRQYRHGNIIISHVPHDKKVLIVDDFHKSPLLHPSRDKDFLSFLEQLMSAEFPMVVLVSDNMTAKFQTVPWKRMEEDFGIERYAFVPFGHKKRFQLIEKWVRASDECSDDVQKILDRSEERVNLMVAENHMPDYPFFILAILQAMDVEGGEKMSSYGHCYKALIVHALVHKGKVKPGEVGACVNFLMELGYHLYHTGNRSGELTEGKFHDFFRSYKKEFNMTFSAKKMQSTLVDSGLLTQNLYDLFFQEYVFYYFVALHLSKRLGDDKEAAEQEIAEICNNAHKKKCSSVILFLIHHEPRNSFLMRKLKENMDALFADCQPSTLDSEETSFFAEQIREIPIRPIEKIGSARMRRIGREKKRERDNIRVQHRNEVANRAEELEDDGKANKVLSELSKSLRMLSIMGQLLKNQQGEMRKNNLVNVSIDTQQMALRVLAWQHSNMRNYPDVFIDFIQNVLLKKHRSELEGLTELERKEVLNGAFSMFAFAVSHSIIDRIANAVGSDQLLDISRDVADNIDTPAAHLVDISIQGWYGNDLDLDKIGKLSEEWKEKNPAAFRLLVEAVRTYSRLQKVDRKTQGKIQKILDVSSKEQTVLGYKRSKR